MPGDSKRTSSDLFFLVLVVLAVLKMALVRYFALGQTNPLSAFLLETALVVVVLGVVDLIPSRRRYLLTLSAYVALSVLMLVMTVYVSFYSQLLDPRMLSMAGQLGTVKGSIRSLIKPVYLLFFIDVPLLAWWAISLGRADKRRIAEAASSEIASADSGDAAEPTPPSRRRVLGRSKWVAGATVLALVVFAGQIALALQIPGDVDGVAIAGLRGLGVAQSAVFFPQGSEGTAHADPVEAVLAPASSSVPTVAPGSVASTLPVTPGSKMQERIETVRGAENGSRIATFSPGAYAGKNIILIQVEALNTMLVQKQINGVDITPNINAVIQESWYFPNTYSQTGIGNTADAEFVVNSSLYAPKGQAASVAYVGKALPALPRLLAEQKGYDTFTMHQNQVAYWNRRELYATLGFSRFYDVKYFGWDDRFNEMGASDEVLFKRGGKLLREADATSSPFYAQVITLSAHGPFDLVPQARRPIRTPKDLKGSLMGDYISVESYSDLALGQFITQLKADGIWDDSIVVIYGDHTAMNENVLSGKDARGAKQLLGRAYSAADRQRVPLIIHLPGQTKPQVVSSTAGQVDIMPTVADLVGLDLRAAPHMGRSLFVNSNALVPTRAYLPGGTFANDTVLFMPGVGFKDGKAVSIATGERVEKTDRERTDMARVAELNTISDEWARGLPRRKDAPKKLINGWIPGKEAREAAAPLGATQSEE